MKFLKDKLWAILLLIVGLFTGLLLRQPQVNRLKKQVQTLIADNGRLVKLNSKIQKDYAELLLNVKALRAFSFEKKKVKGNLAENVILQYSLYDYLTILLKCIRAGEKLEKEELRFLNAFEKVVNGDTLSTGDKKNMKDYTIKRHDKEIKQQVPCDCNPLMEDLKLVIA